MTDKQYAAFKRAAFAAKKLDAGQITALEPRDLELIKSLLKDPDGYRRHATANGRTESQAQQDIDRCSRVFVKLAGQTCSHGFTRCPYCYDANGFPLCPHGKRPFDGGCTTCEAEVHALFG